MGAALYLACKLEEQPRRLRDIITVLDYLKKKANKQQETILDISSQVLYLKLHLLIFSYITIFAKEFWRPRSISLQNLALMFTSNILMDFSSIIYLD